MLIEGYGGLLCTDEKDGLKLMVYGLQVGGVGEIEKKTVVLICECVWHRTTQQRVVCSCVRCEQENLSTGNCLQLRLRDCAKA